MKKNIDNAIRYLSDAKKKYKEALLYLKQYAQTSKAKSQMMQIQGEITTIENIIKRLRTYSEAADQYILDKKNENNPIKKDEKLAQPQTAELREIQNEFLKILCDGKKLDSNKAKNACEKYLKEVFQLKTTSKQIEYVERSKNNIYVVLKDKSAIRIELGGKKLKCDTTDGISYIM